MDIHHQAVSAINAHTMANIFCLGRGRRLQFDVALYDGQQVLTPGMIIQEINSVHVRRSMFLRMGIRGLEAYYDNGIIGFRPMVDSVTFFDDYPQLLWDGVRENPYQQCKIVIDLTPRSEDEILPRRFTLKACETLPKGIFLYVARLFENEAWPGVKYAICNKVGMPADDDIIWAVLHKLSFGKLI